MYTTDYLICCPAVSDVAYYGQSHVFAVLVGCYSLFAVIRWLYMTSPEACFCNIQNPAYSS